MKKRYIFVFVFMFFCVMIKNYSFADEILNIMEADMQVGDYVTYSAGTWTKEEINRLDEAGLFVDRNKIEKGKMAMFHFYGFNVGDSRDVNTNANGTFATGWRILTTSRGAIGIISTGCTELYGSPFGKNYSYITKYILSGEKDETDSTDITKDYNSRDWSMYEDLDYIIPGYTHVIMAGDIFEVTNSYDSTDNNLRNIGEKYITSTIHCNEDMGVVFEDGTIEREAGNVYGIRLEMYLKDTLKVKNIGKSSDGYNIWKLIKEDEVITEETKPSEDLTEVEDSIVNVVVDNNSISSNTIDNNILQNIYKEPTVIEQDDIVIKGISDIFIIVAIIVLIVFLFSIIIVAIKYIRK